MQLLPFLIRLDFFRFPVVLAYLLLMCEASENQPAYSLRGEKEAERGERSDWVSQRKYLRFCTVCASQPGWGAEHWNLEATQKPSAGNRF